MDLNRGALNEMKGVLTPNGELIVIDAVRPRSAARYPLAWVIRKLDRGQWIRDEAGHHDLLRRAGLTLRSSRRSTFAWTGLELDCLIAHRQANDDAGPMVMQGVSSTRARELL